MEANDRWGASTGRFMSTEELAAWVASGSAAAEGGQHTLEERATQ
jgi:hypothetical protein